MPLSSLCLLLALQIPKGGMPVFDPDSALTTPVSGLEQTDAISNVVDVSGQNFSHSLRVKIQKDSTETNATQLSVPIASAVKAGDTLLATLWVRGRRASGGAGRAEFIFERATDPWTKSVIQDVSAGPEWRRYLIPFSAAQSYAPGEAMASFRLAFGPQVVEIGGVDVSDFGSATSLESMVEAVLAASPMGTVPVRFGLQPPRQTMLGLGGDFCQPRYGGTEPLDAVGSYVLEHLHVVHARIGLPLNYWEPKEGEFRNDPQVEASFGTLAVMSRRKIPTVVSIWEAPGWMLGGSPEQAGRVLPKEKYSACIEAIARYLTLARDKYGTTVDFISFNEPDYGVNFKFTSDTMRDFIREAGPRFAELGLKTRFVVGDTGGGANYVAYAAPILEDPTIAKYLGPIAFHCWDVLTSSDEEYEGIAALGKKFGKPVWCLEAGHDSGLWQASNPWGTWDNALRTAMAYERTIRLSGTSLMDYWTYEDNYPIVDKSSLKPYPVLGVMEQLESIFKPGSQVVAASVGNPDLQALGTIDRGGRLSVLIVNSGGAGKVVVSGFGRVAGVQVETRDKSGLKGTVSVSTLTGTITIPVPMRSVVTMVSPPSPRIPIEHRE